MTDRARIDDLYARFVDAVSCRSGSRLSGLFTDDATVEGPLEPPREGVDAIVASMTAGFGNWDVLLLVPQALLVLGDAPAVRTRWYLLEVGRRDGDDVLYAGVYHDDLAEQDGALRFRRRRFDLLYARTGAGALVPPLPTVLAANAEQGASAAEDASG